MLPATAPDLARHGTETMAADARDVGIERGLDVEPSTALAFAPHCRLSLIPDVLGLPGSGKDRPGVFQDGWLDDRGNRHGKADVYVWVLAADEFQAFARLAHDRDREDRGFATLTLDRVKSGDGGNLCLALGTSLGVMSGFMVRDRTVWVKGEDKIRYNLDCDRAYLLPEARGKGLTRAMVGITRAIFEHEMDVLAAGLASRRGETLLTPVLSGYADSDGGARMLNRMASEMGTVYGARRAGPGGVTIAGLIDDVDSYDPEATPSP